MIELQRIYDKNQNGTGVRILVDRLWPRGISKEEAKLDYWLKEIAPSNELRKSFHQGDMDFTEFRRKYKEELKNGEQRENVKELKRLAKEKEKIILLYGAKDKEENQAVILKELIEDEQ
ncbi:DUF488 family protein [Oceanobacillus piezotolerans]|uniref:DUF488 family protein n=1 Tax=Oceanobacillus piezotolerans TaxID=2448030 RepID=A0A498DK77_9BACI|nr:DUF488 family protein [Oceanobacillus piezotolerans]RLL42835.1 DUF488 family protein [Oceanobacillus piezotolerans]